MTDPVAAHYEGVRDIAAAIAERLRSVGREPARLAPAELAPVDQFHIRGRDATLELAEHMNLSGDYRVLDIGSGLGGPARTIAETYGCHVTGIDLSQAFCDAAATMSAWVGLAHGVSFHQGDATVLPFADDRFDAAMSVHAAMNIAAKDRMFAEARRVVKPGGVFAVFDVMQGEGGDVLFPVPWAREPSISHLVTPGEMVVLLSDAGLEIVAEQDTTAESEAWFQNMAARMSKSGPPPVSFQIFLGEDFMDMARNQVRNLAERRIRTVSYVCRA